MFRASLCPSSGDRLNKAASGVSLDVLAAVVCRRDTSWVHCVNVGIQSVSWRWAQWCPKHVELKVNKHLYLCHPLVLSSPAVTTVSKEHSDYMFRSEPCKWWQYVPSGPRKSWTTVMAPHPTRQQSWHRSVNTVFHCGTTPQITNQTH